MDQTSRLYLPRLLSLDVDIGQWLGMDFTGKKYIEHVVGVSDGSNSLKQAKYVCFHCEGC